MYFKYEMIAQLWSMSGASSKETDMKHKHFETFSPFTMRKLGIKEANWQKFPYYLGI